MRRLVLVSVTTIAVSGALMAPAKAASTEGDRVYVGDTTIEAGDVVNGNVTVKRGDLIVEGEVNGDARQVGRGGVEVRGGVVRGSIRESGAGMVRVGFWDGTGSGTGNDGIGECVTDGRVFGNIDERGPGADYNGVDELGQPLVVYDIGVIVECGGSVMGNVDERAGGDVTVVDPGSRVGGDVRESGQGDLLGLIFGEPTMPLVDGNACERGPGEAFFVPGTLGGDLLC